MYLDPLIDTIEEALELRAAAKAAKSALLTGDAITNWASGDTNVQLAGMNLEQINEVIRETKEFLQKADPDTYGVQVKKARGIFLY
jgi:hypothetical protein